MNDVLERLRAHPNRLTHYERAMLHGGGDLAFRKGAAPVNDPTHKPGRSPWKSYGQVRALALRVIAGEFGGATLPEVIATERARRKAAGLPDLLFSDQSLRNTIWKLRNDAGAAKRGAAA